MKKFLYFILGCMVVGMLLSTVLSLIPAFPTEAKAFLRTLSQGRYEDAYTLCSNDFKKQYSLPLFIKVVKEEQLDQYNEKMDINWIEKKEGVPDKDHGSIIGIVPTKSRTRLPVVIYFVQNYGNSWLDRGWRINGVQSGDDVLKQVTVKPSH